MRRTLVVNPLPRDASDLTAFGALALDQPRHLLLAPVGHRMKLGVRIRPNRFEDRRQKPFKRFAFGGRSHLAFQAERLRHHAKPHTWPVWLGEETAGQPQLKAMLAPYPSEEMTCWPVSARVGNVKNNDPSLIEPIAV